MAVREALGSEVMRFFMKMNTLGFPRTSVLLVLFSWLSAAQATGQSCPVEVVGNGTSSKEDRLFVLTPSGTGLDWKELPRQWISETSSSGSEESKLYFSADENAVPWVPVAQFPCAASAMREVRMGARYAYLAKCSPGSPALNGNWPTVASMDRAANSVRTSRYEYEYVPNNQLMFSSLRLKTAVDKEPIEVSKEAQILLHLDIKHFFTLNFTNDSVESYLSNESSGPVGLSAAMAFSLKILMFKLKIKITALAGFFERSANIPMFIDVPVDAPSNLNHGSGLLYSWKNVAATIDRSKPEIDLPAYDSERIKKGPEALAPLGARYCNGAWCTFRMLGQVNGSPYGMTVKVPRSVVELGFFPMYVDNIKKFKKDLEWDDDAKDSADRVAIFFPNSGLPKGQYRLDYWIQMEELGQPSRPLAQCPQQGEFGRVISRGEWAH